MKDQNMPSKAYNLFKAYVRFYHDKVCYRKIFTEGMENVPQNGTPLLIVSNHQNGVSDPLGIVMSFRDRKPNVITRADVFALHPLANKFLRAIGLLPAFRLDHEGEEALGNNTETFKVSEKALLDGGTVAMYPESGHQDKRWLGPFSLGYTKLAFEAAEMGNFEKEIFILPACNHYSHYFGIRHQMMIRYGKPVSLAPYYELYKTKPRTAQREVNKLVRAQIESMMLDVRDLDHYDQIDFLRTTYGVKYAVSAGVDTENLPAMLESDKKFVAALAEAMNDKCVSDETISTDATTASASSADVEKIYADTKTLQEGIKELGIEDRHFDNQSSLLSITLRSVLALILLPLWISWLWPGIFMYAVAKYFACYRMKDRMMESTFLIALSVLFWIPIFSILTFVVGGLTAGWLQGLIWVALFPVTFIFTWDYAKGVEKLFADIRCYTAKGKEKFAALKELRKSIYDRLDNILKK